jgi:hypothetical protein
VSFQSTSSTNISTVNALNSNQLFVVKKERGQGASKRKWGIEMNEARKLCSKTCGRIDTIDSLIGHCHLCHRSWKHWHSAKNHGTALAIVVACETCKERAEGEIRSEWKIPPKKFMDFHTFRDRLSAQGLECSPTFGRHSGDRAMKVHTKLSLKDRKKFYEEDVIRPRRAAGRPSNASIRIIASSSKESLITPEQHQNGKRSRTKSRLCGDFGHLSSHLGTFHEPPTKIKNGKACQWCGEMAFTRCLVRDAALHFFPDQREQQG